MIALAKYGWWRAQPLAKAARQPHFRRTLALHAESVLLGRSAIIAGWCVGGVGLVMILAASAMSVYVNTRPPPDPQYFGVDRSTGQVSDPVSAGDAPAVLFNDLTDESEIQDYIQACWQWDPAMDNQNWRKCMLMSTSEQQARYTAWRELASSPPKALGAKAFTQNENFRFFKQAGDDKTSTRRYIVLFDQTVWHGTTKDPAKPISATVEFAYHPELPMKIKDRRENRAGFQGVSLTQKEMPK